MRFIVLFLAVLFSANAWGAQVAHKCMLAEPQGYDTNCRLTVNDTLNHIEPQTITAVGTIGATSSCFDAWTSGVNFAYAWEAIQTGKVAGRCIKRPHLYIDTDLDPGKNGFLEGFDPSPAGATGQPCAHTISGETVILYKYTCYTGYGD